MSKEAGSEMDVLKFLEMEEKKPRTGKARGSTNRVSSKQYKSIPKQQRYVHNRIMATSEKRQVVVKVVYSKVDKRGGGGSRSSGVNRKGMGSVKRLSEYLEKDAATNFEMRDGNEFESAKDLDGHIQDEWSPDFTKRKNGSDILHVVVSTPQGSDRDGTLRAAREFGREFFEKNDYAFVRHDDTHNPHVHFLIKVKGDDGSRLNLGKQDLELAREMFAHHAREQGIDVAASRRSWRGAEKTFLRRDSENGDIPMSARDYYKGKEGEGGWLDAYKAAQEKEAAEFERLALVFEKNTNQDANKLAKQLRGHSAVLLNRIKDKFREEQAEPEKGEGR